VILHSVPLVVSWGLYGTHIEVVTHYWLVSLEGACGVGRVQFRAGCPGGSRVVLAVTVVSDGLLKHLIILSQQDGKPNIYC